MFPAHPRTFVAFRVCEVDEQVSAWILDICGCLHDVGGISMLFSRQRVENAQIPRQTRCVTPLVIKADGTCHSIFFGGGFNFDPYVERETKGFRKWNCCKSTHSLVFSEVSTSWLPFSVFLLILDMQSNNHVAIMVGSINPFLVYDMESNLQ